jgi:hypothetical protein
MAGTPAVEPPTGVGHSDTWNLAEALQDAIGNIPPQPPSEIVDELYTYRVVSIGAEIGGIAGLNRLVVVVQQLGQT